jgi:large subunit ribosomal protein L5
MLARITGQKPALRPARKSVDSFKLREGQTAGVVVTLRGKRAADFLTRLVRVVLPRTRDFRGIPRTSLDGAGNLSIGIREQIVFPDAAVEPTGILFGLQVTVVTTARNREEAEAFFRLKGFPLQSGT